MSQRFVAKKRHDSHVTNLDILRKSVIELREIYSEMSDMDFAAWYYSRVQFQSMSR